MVVPVNVTPKPQHKRTQATKTPKPGPKTRFDEYPGLMQRLTGKYGQVIGFDQHAPAPPPPDCVRIAVDVGSDESVTEGLRMLRAHHGSKIASVIHPAAYYDFLGEPNPKYEDITVQGTNRLLRGLQDNCEV